MLSYAILSYPYRRRVVYLFVYLIVNVNMHVILILRPSPRIRIGPDRTRPDQTRLDRSELGEKREKRREKKEERRAIANVPIRSHLIRFQSDSIQVEFDSINHDEY